MNSFDEHFMRMALREAEKAAADGEVPLGCVIVAPKVIEPAHDGHPAVYDPDPTQARILGRAHNQTEGLSDATAHAEMLAMSSAFAAVGDWRLTGARLYVTKEPCPMCAGGIVLARLETVVWGVSDPKRGGGTTFGIFGHPGINHHPEIVTGVLEEESKAILQEFFRDRRAASDDTHRTASALTGGTVRCCNAASEGAGGTVRCCNAASEGAGGTVSVSGTVK